MDKLAYGLALEGQDGEWIARVPQFPEVLTSGVDHDDARLQAEDALRLAVTLRLKHGEHVPMPVNVEENRMVAELDPKTSARVLAANDQPSARARLFHAENFLFRIKRRLIRFLH